MLSDTGGGHRAVSKAVAAALEDRGATTTLVDLFALEDGKRLADRFTRMYGPVIRFQPALYGLAYHATNSRWLFERINKTIEGPYIERAKTLIQTEKPDVIVCVHALVIRAMMAALASLGLTIPVVTVIPDLVTAHRSWVVDGVTVYTAPTEEAADLLYGYGVSREHITVTGLPANAAFQNNIDVATTRRSFGLAADRLTVLIAGGGEGAGNLPQIIQAIDDVGLPIQLMVVCGRNAAALKHLQAHRPKTPAVLFGFVDFMATLVACADVVVTKGGPQSIVEALAAGKPVLVTGVLPGQDPGTDEYIERHGAGYRAHSLNRLVGILGRLVNAPKERESLGRAAKELAKTDAAQRVASVILDSIRE